MKRTLLLTTLLTAFGFGTFAQDVIIPDANFKALLVGNVTINTNSDTEIQVTEAAAFTGNIFANNQGITDLTGIEEFTSLTGLYVRDNALGSFDISANTALEYIDCQNTGISTLDISNNTMLGGMDCAFNSLTSLDLSNNTAITSLNCGSNSLTTLDVSNNPLLSNFSCDNNDLTSIDLSNNTSLFYFVCPFNDLTSLDVSNCTALSWLSFSVNDISTIDLSNNTDLGNLFCAQNNLTILDVSANSSLIVLNCTDNDLSILDVSNGNNTNFVTYNSLGNPNLACIEVDDAAYSTANWTDVDGTSSFSNDCNYGLGIGETNLDQNITVYPNPSTTQINIEINEQILSATIIDALGNKINTNLHANNSIDVSTLSRGVYFLQVETTSGVISKRFVKK